MVAPAAVFQVALPVWQSLPAATADGNACTAPHDHDTGHDKRNHGPQATRDFRLPTDSATEVRNPQIDHDRDDSGSNSNSCGGS